MYLIIYLERFKMRILTYSNSGKIFKFSNQKSLDENIDSDKIAKFHGR